MPVYFAEFEISQMEMKPYREVDYSFKPELSCTVCGHSFDKLGGTLAVWRYKDYVQGIPNIHFCLKCLLEKKEYIMKSIDALPRILKDET